MVDAGSNVPDRVRVVPEVVSVNVPGFPFVPHVIFGVEYVAL